jgi:hypothetical protein
VSVGKNNGSFILIKVMSNNKDAKFSICFLVHGVYVTNDPWTRWRVASQVQPIRMHQCLFTYQKKNKKFICICHF